MKKAQSSSLGAVADDGKFLAGWLNSPDGSWGHNPESQQRIRALVMQLATLREKAAKGISLEDTERDSINAALRCYPWVLRLEYPLVRRQGKISRSAVPRFVDWPSAAPEEAQIFLVMIINLARAGLLERLRRCAHCTAWYFAAKNPKALYCSTPCKQKVFRSQPGYKKKNREYQKTHYELLKEILKRSKENRYGKKR